jgi:quercetin dioxygenase-like cupin family protein
MHAGIGANLDDLVGAAPDRVGVIWALRESGDLNANLVRFDAGGGVGEHVNEKLDVLFVGVTGSGWVRVGGEEHRLSAGTLVFAPRGVRRSTVASSEGFAYLTIHRRAGPLRVGN